MKIKSDILIIGSGLAGLHLAHLLSDKFNIIIATKSGVLETNTRYAQGGIATVISPEDDFQSHIDDTIIAGSHLGHEDVIQKIISDAPRLIQKLESYGVNFSKTKTNQYDLGREGGHSKRRILHTGDTTGLSLAQAVHQAVKKNPKISILENHIAIDLIKKDPQIDSPESNQCLGAYILDIGSNQVKTIESKITILATGGAGRAYLYTSNPSVATGDGIAMAYRAGLTISNLEFVQFHPTCFYNPAGHMNKSESDDWEKHSLLISEALRGEGAILKRIDGSEFMSDYHKDAELAPRDIVARAIDFEMKKHGDPFVYLDISHLDSDHLKNRFPYIYETCLKFGIDLTKEPIPVVPAAHYFCGGVKAEVNGRTEMPALYTIGETACTGLHGANRLASNSLLEALAMADYAAEDILNRFNELNNFSTQIEEWEIGNATNLNEEIIISQNWQEIRTLLWNYVGLVRSNHRLKKANQRIKILQEEIKEYYWNFLLTKDLIELRNVGFIAEITIKSASLRKESRGLHYNVDYPEMKDSERKDTLIKLTL